MCAQLTNLRVIQAVVRQFAFRILVPDSEQLIGIRQWQRPEHERIYDAEDDRVGPDAERERKHRHGSEAGVLEQLARGEFEIIHDSAAVDASRVWIMTKYE